METFCLPVPISASEMRNPGTAHQRYGTPCSLLRSYVAQAPTLFPALVPSKPKGVVESLALYFVL
jgi:hypothetical protein